MSATAIATSNTAPRNGHSFSSDEEAALMITSLSNRVSIELDGVDIVRGNHKKLGFVTIVTPAAGRSCLLYPFEF